MANIDTVGNAPAIVNVDAYVRDLTSSIVADFGTGAFGFLKAVQWNKVNPKEANIAGFGDKIRRNYVPTLKVEAVERSTVPAHKAPNNEFNIHEDSYLLNNERQVSIPVEAEAFRQIRSGGGDPSPIFTKFVQRAAIALLAEFEDKLADEATRKVGAVTTKANSAGFFQEHSVSGVVDYEDALKLREIRDKGYEDGGLEMSGEDRCYIVMAPGDATRYRKGLTGYSWGDMSKEARKLNVMPDMGGGLGVASYKLGNVGPSSAVTGLRVDKAGGIKIGDQTFNFDVSARLSGAIPAGTILNIADGSSFVLQEAIARGADSNQSGTIKVNRPFNIKGDNNKAITTEVAGPRLVGLCGDWAELAVRLPLRGIESLPFGASGDKYNLETGTHWAFDFSQIENGIPVAILVSLIPGSNGGGTLKASTLYGYYVEAGNVAVVY